MNFKRHYNLEGLHATFSPSQPSWLRYTDERATEIYLNRKAAEQGSKLHRWAKETIDLGIKQPRSKKTIYAYVNDAIGFQMDTEVVLFYSERFFGTADAISFRNGLLRIHDLKTGIRAVHIEQLRIYAALFCLEYQFSPYDIEIELRIYQNDDCEPEHPDPEIIRGIMDHIIHLDKLLQDLETEGG